MSGHNCRQNPLCQPPSWAGERRRAGRPPAVRGRPPRRLPRRQGRPGHRGVGWHVVAPGARPPGRPRRRRGHPDRDERPPPAVPGRRPRRAGGGAQDPATPGSRCRHRRHRRRARRRRRARSVGPSATPVCACPAASIPSRRPFGLSSASRSPSPGHAPSPAGSSPRPGSRWPSTADRVTHVFPTPDAVAALDPETLPMPRSRGRTIVELAGRVARGELDLDHGADRAGVAAGLLDVPGIGPWTAGYVLMRGLGDPDVFLPTDLGVRAGLAAVGCHRRARRPLATVALVRGPPPLVGRMTAALARTTDRHADRRAHARRLVERAARGLVPEQAHGRRRVGRSVRTMSWSPRPASSPSTSPARARRSTSRSTRRARRSSSPRGAA